MVLGKLKVPPLSKQAVRDPPLLAPPLYYASLFGFRDLATHIIFNDPEQVNAKGGCNYSSLGAAL